MLAVVRDITDRKNAEKALTQSEQKFRAIFDHAPYGIAINSLDGKYLDVNQACADSIGMSKEEVLSLQASEVSQVTKEGAAVIIATMQRDGVVKNLETSVQSHDGSLIHVLYSSVLVQLQGEPQILSMTVNITDKKRAEAALRHSEATLRSLFSAVPVGLATLQNRVFRSVNERFCEIVGYAEAALVGCSSKMMMSIKRLVNICTMRCGGMASATPRRGFADLMGLGAMYLYTPRLCNLTIIRPGSPWPSRTSPSANVPKKSCNSTENIWRNWSPSAPSPWNASMLNCVRR